MERMGMTAKRGRKVGIRNRRFAEWILQARLDAKLTQEQLAELLDVSQGTIHLWEKYGVEAMPPAQIKRVAIALRVEPAAVAQALGYPVLMRGVQEEGDLSHLPPDAAEFVRFGERLAELRRDWLEWERRLGLPGTGAPESSDTGAP